MPPRALLCAALVGLLGCGETTPTATEDTTPGASPNPVDSMPDPGHVIGDAPPGSSGSSGSSTPPPVAAGHGFVTLRTVPASGTTASAAFWNGAEPDAGLDADGCRLGPLPSVPPGATLLSAGDIDISLQGTLARLEYSGPSDGYAPKSFGWQADSSSPVVSALAPFGGATVPDFTGLLAVVAAPKVTTLAADGIAASADFAVGWEPVESNVRVVVTLEGAQAMVTCLVPSAATSFTIAAARVKLVTDHPAALTDCASCAKLTVEARSESPVTAGPYAIALRHEHATVAALAVH